MSSNKTVRVAVTQAEPAWLDLPAAIKKTCDLITEAAKGGAKLIAFPECWIPGYPCWIWTRLVDFEINVKYIKNSLCMSSKDMQIIQDCARDNSISVCLGFSENDHGSLYISQAIIGPDGEIKMHRRKMKPTHMERTIFGDASGHCLSDVVDLPIGRTGTLACWEHIQPLLKFHTFAQKEQIHISAWPSVTPHSGGGDLYSMSAEGCQTLSRTYAIESQTFVLHSTALITDKGVEAMKTAGGALMSSPGGGSSAVFGPDGRRLTDPVDEKTEKIIYADLDFDDILKSKMFADASGHYSRPDLLWVGTEPGVKKVVRSGAVDKKSKSKSTASDAAEPIKDAAMGQPV